MLQTCCRARTGASARRVAIAARGRRTLRIYADAVTALNSLQSNSAVVQQFRKSGQGMNQAAIPEMIEWLHRAGYQQSDLAAFNAVHIAGTKGKGSTSAFVSSILEQYHASGSLGRVGLYTSPHLRFVRERIQIDGKWLSEQEFADDFFEVFDRFDAVARAEDKPTDATAKPAYFRYLTIMAFHSYIKAGVQSAVIECGMGGEYDSTNVLDRPTVIGITSLGIDHKEALGNTIESIAWHKAGIMKPGARALTVVQPPAALAVLQQRAKEKGVTLDVVPVHPDIESDKLELGLGGSFQKSNASLAIELAAEHLRRLGYGKVSVTDLPPAFVRGLAAARLGGRCEIRHEGKIAWHLDGAHTVESIQAAAQWFLDVTRNGDEPFTTSTPRILIFNQQNRDDARALLATLRKSLVRQNSKSSPFTHAIFCTNLTFNDMGYRPDLVSINSDKAAVESLKVQQLLAKSWEEIDDAAGAESGQRAFVSICRTVEEALEIARISASAPAVPKDAGVQVLVTGSMHLVGGALEVLETQAERAV